ncbi:catalase [Salmonella enterica subsp. enterica]|nr:catalase [Salmonella enterica subsp. enterica]
MFQQRRATAAGAKRILIVGDAHALIGGQRIIFAAFTKAAFLCDPQKITPVFVRFSTVQGGAGSADTVRC